MNLFEVTNYIKSELTLLGVQQEDITQSSSNADIANTAGVITYLLTSDSKNQTVRTIGGASSVLAFIYGSSERRKSNKVRKLHKQNILNLVDYVSYFDCQILHNEKDVLRIREFLQYIITISQYLDSLVLDDISKVKGKGHLGSRNIQIFMGLTRDNVFSAKIKLEKLLSDIDRNRNPFNAHILFESAISQLKYSEIKKEGLIIKIVVILLLIFGAMLFKSDESVAAVLLMSGLLFWITNHVYPLFINTRQLRKIVNEFLKCLELTVGKETLNYQT